jgi:hypothetical protein
MTEFLSLNWQFSAFSHNLTRLISFRDQHQQLERDGRICFLAISLAVRYWGKDSTVSFTDLDHW